MASGPSASTVSSSHNWINRLPRIFSCETSAPIFSPACCRAIKRAALASRAISRISSSAKRARNQGWSAMRAPLSLRVIPASFARAMRRLFSPMRASFSRSNSSSDLATVHPLFSSPMIWSAGTATLSRNTSLNTTQPWMPAMGRTVMPGDFMSISRKEMPSCSLPSRQVRTRQNIQSAYCA